MVAIARALDMSAKLLILDEPTSSLDKSEVAELFSVIRRLRDQGLGIVFVTHFLDQVYAILTALRCCVTASWWEHIPLGAASIGVGSKMIGRDVTHLSQAARFPRPANRIPRGEPFVEARQRGRVGSIAPVDLTIGHGEILGLAGLLGSGRTETARLMFGIDRIDSGEVLVEGKPLPLRSPRAAIRAGFGFTPENRKSEGIIPDLSMRENIVLALQGSRGSWRALSRAAQGQIADRFIKALGIKTPSAGTAGAKLSGGISRRCCWHVGWQPTAIADFRRTNTWH